MIINPIIPIWLMLIITIVFIVFIIKQNKKINKKVILRLSLIIILFLMNIRPMIRNNESTVSSENLNILFAIDTTISMNAEDSKTEETRLAQVKKDCAYIIKKFPSATYSIITFNNTSKINIPFTTDATMVTNQIEVLQVINENYGKGSSLNTPMDDILSQLKNVKEKNDNSNILFFISDGEITNDDKLKSFSKIKEYVDNGAVLGYGSTKGGYMQYYDYYGKKQYVKYYDSNYREQKGLSKIDENNLKSIAKDLDIEYIHMDKSNDIDSVLKEITKVSKSKLTKNNQESFDDLYYILALPLLIVLFLIYKEYKEEYSL